MLAANLTSCDSLKALVFTGCWFKNGRIRAKNGLLFTPALNTVGKALSLRILQSVSFLLKPVLELLLSRVRLNVDVLGQNCPGGSGNFGCCWGGCGAFKRLGNCYSWLNRTELPLVDTPEKASANEPLYSSLVYFIMFFSWCKVRCFLVVS